MIDYRLHVFREVAEMRNLTKASRALHLSQPAVTKHIKLLEESLHLPLFTRSSSGVMLTEAGVIFLRHVQAMEKAHAAVLEQLQAPTGQLTGRIRLGCSMTVASYFVPRVLAPFRAEYPAVSCEVLEGNTDFVVGQLLDQRIDVGLVEGPCRRWEIQVQPFFEDEIIWIASPTDPVIKARHFTLKMLMDRPIISRELGSGTRRVVESALRRGGIALNKLKIIQELPNAEAIKRMVASGAGIGYVPRMSVEQELASGKVVQINNPQLQIKRAFSVLTPQGPDPIGIVQAFVRFLIRKKY